MYKQGKSKLLVLKRIRILNPAPAYDGGTRRLEEVDWGAPHPTASEQTRMSSPRHLLCASPHDHMKFSLPGLQASELDRQNPTSKYTSTASSLPLGQSMIQSEKDSWSSSSDFDGELQIGI